MLFDYFRKRQIKQRFKEYVDPKMVDYILRQDPELPSQSSVQIDFILLLVRDNGVDETANRMALVTDLALAHRAWVFGGIGPLVLLAYRDADSTSAGRRKALVDALQAGLRDDVRMIHGVSLSHVGDFGNSTRSTYTALIPGFAEVLATLCRLEPGQAHEFIQSQMGE